MLSLNGLPLNKVRWPLLPEKTSEKKGKQSFICKQPSFFTFIGAERLPVLSKKKERKRKRTVNYHKLSFNTTQPPIEAHTKNGHFSVSPVDMIWRGRNGRASVRKSDGRGGERERTWISTSVTIIFFLSRMKVRYATGKPDMVFIRPLLIHIFKFYYLFRTLR